MLKFSHWKTQKKSFYLPLFIFLSALISCQKKETSDFSSLEVVKVEVVASPLIKAIVDNASSHFTQNPTLVPGSSLLHFNFRYVDDVQAVQKIASGELKVDAWFGIPEELTIYANQQVSGLGAQLIECQALYATALVLATNSKTAKKFGSEDNRFSLIELLSKVKNSASLDSHERLLISSYSPITSGLGAAALLATSSIGELTTSQFSELLFRYEDLPPDQLYHGLARETSIPIATFTLESSLFQYLGNSPAAQLVALYPVEYTSPIKFSLCSSSAPWTTPAKRAGIAKLGDFLKADSTQQLAFANKYRDRNGQGSLSEHARLHQESHKKGDIFSQNIKSWSQLKKNSATVFILDTSGYFSGSPFERTRAALAYALRKLPNTSKSYVITAGHNIETISNWASDSTNNEAQIFKITTGGSFDLVNTLREAFRLLKDDANTGVSRKIVVFTAGVSRNSPIELTAPIRWFENESDISLKIFTYSDLASSPNALSAQEISSLARPYQLHHQTIQSSQIESEISSYINQL
jgi:hypothetical protein